jgi:hypothetical protein
MDGLKEKLVKHGFLGELDDSAETRELFSHDASMFELVPKLVASPKDSADVQRLVRFVAANKKKHPELSLTARAAGTDMAGGSINDSIIINFAKHFTKIGPVSALSGTAQPGVFYRDFEAETLKHGSLMLCFCFTYMYMMRRSFSVLMLFLSKVVCNTPNKRHTENNNNPPEPILLCRINHHPQRKRKEKQICTIDSNSAHQ